MEFPRLGGIHHWGAVAGTEDIYHGLTCIVQSQPQEHILHCLCRPPLPVSALWWPVQAAPLPAMLTAFLGLEVRDGVELGFHARNIFHQVRQQFPIGDEIGSELFATITVEF